MLKVPFGGIPPKGTAVEGVLCVLKCGRDRRRERKRRRFFSVKTGCAGGSYLARTEDTLRMTAEVSMAPMARAAAKEKVWIKVERNRSISPTMQWRMAS